MQYYVLKEKLEKIITDNDFFSGKTLDDIIYEKCPYHGHIVRQELANNTTGFPTRNSGLIAELCKALQCTRRDFALHKHEKEDSLHTQAALEMMFSSPLDYDISHYH